MDLGRLPGVAAVMRLVIDEKVRPYPLALVGPHHFRYREAEAVDPAVVLARPDTYSLYCLDHERRRAIFVETPPKVDLAAAPFYCQAQYAAATGLVAVDYDDLHALADRVEERRMILVYSVGRCGSTLVSRVLSTVDGVTSLSEPDVLTQLVTLRSAGRCDPAEVDRLARSCTRLAGAGADGTVAIKFRSAVVDLADVLHRHFPAASVVFLYRNAADWVRSSLRAFGTYDPAMATDLTAVQDRLGLLFPLLAEYRDRKGRVLTLVEGLACQWVGIMERALALGRQGVPMFPVSYEELTADPRGVLAALFVHCGIPPVPAGTLDRILAADSQAGTSISRDRVRTAAGAPDLSEPAALAELQTVIAELSTTVTPGTAIGRSAGADRRLAQGSAV